jgi:hypothetical protein
VLFKKKLSPTLLYYSILNAKKLEIDAFDQLNVNSKEQTVSVRRNRKSIILNKIGIVSYGTLPLSAVHWEGIE